MAWSSIPNRGGQSVSPETRVIIATKIQGVIHQLLSYIKMNYNLTIVDTRESILNDPHLCSAAAILFTDRPNDINARDFCERFERLGPNRPRLVAVGVRSTPWLTFVEGLASVDAVVHIDSPLDHQIQIFNLMANLRAEASIAALGEEAKAIWNESRRLMQDIDVLVRAGQPVPSTAVHAIAASVVGQSDDTLFFDIIRILRDHHSETLVHSLDMALHAMLLGRHVGVRGTSDQCLLFEAGMLHDLGKAEVPVPILTKPGKLTAEEFAVIRRHPLSSEKILRESGGFDEQLILAALEHHEKNDGTGYPHGLAGNRISEIGRLMAVCDVYCALTERRAYKAQTSAQDAFAIMDKMTGHHLDPVLVGRLKEMVCGSVVVPLHAR